MTLETRAQPAQAFRLEVLSECWAESDLGGTATANYEQFATMSIRVNEPLMSVVRVQYVVAAPQGPGAVSVDSMMQFSGPAGTAPYGSSAVSISDAIACPSGCDGVSTNRDFNSEQLILWPGTYTLLVNTTASAPATFTSVLTA